MGKLESLGLGTSSASRTPLGLKTALDRQTKEEPQIPLDGIRRSAWSGLLPLESSCDAVRPLASLAPVVTPSPTASRPPVNSGSTANDLVLGLKEAPRGVLRAASEVVKTIAEHPVASIATAGGLVVASLASPFVGTLVVGLGIALGASVTAFSAFQAFKASSAARSPEEHAKAQSKWGDAWGEAAFNGLLLGGPAAAGKLLRGRLTVLAEDLRMPEVPADTTTAMERMSAAIKRLVEQPGFLSNVLDQLHGAGRDALLADLASVALMFPKSSAKAIVMTLASEAFQQADTVRRRVMLLEALGVVALKASQVSANATGMSPELSAALKATRARLTPMSSETLRSILGAPVAGTSDTYVIGGVPYRLGESLGVASIGEAFEATNTLTGKSVVIKLRKPSATAEQVNSEFAFLQAVASKVGSRLEIQPEQLKYITENLEAFRAGIIDELDYANEARNAAGFAKAYGKSYDGIDVLHVEDARGILVMKRAEGIPFTQIDRLGPVERKEAMLAYSKAVIDQIFSGYFHADPQAGNVFWNSATKRIQFIDMGALSTLTIADRVRLGEQILVTFSRSPEGMARFYLANARKVTSTLPKDELYAQLVAALRDEMGSSPAEFGALAARLQKRCQELGVWPTESGLWLQKTLLTMRNVMDYDLRDSLMRFILGRLMREVATVLRTTPGDVRQALVNVARAVGQHPKDFARSVAYAIELAPSDFAGVPSFVIRAVYAMGDVPQGVRVAMASTAPWASPPPSQPVKLAPLKLASTAGYMRLTDLDL
jgi:predicted unusual protein kinase regulating ubiquinone biosynthesis (AarF/ABC1/UbiB family)